MKRHNQILVGILVIQIILSAVVFWPKSATTGEGELIFPDLKAGDIIALTIVDADDNRIVLRRVAGNWVLPAADDYPALSDKITSLLDKIVGLNTSRLVTRTDASHKRLQVASDDFVRRIDFEMADGTICILYLGSSPRYGATHFRVDGRSETYLTGDISAWETNATAASWIDTVYLNVPQTDITKMTLENANGQLTLMKEDTNNEAGGHWTIAGLAVEETLDEAKVTALIQQAASIHMLRPLGKEEKAAYEMDKPNAVVTLETDDKTIILRVGAKDPDDNSYVVISSESPYYVRVSEFSVKDLVEQMRDDLLQTPATPTPTGDTSAP